MSKMIELVEEMRVRLSQITETEQALVRALKEALSQVDQKLLQDVRSIAAEHEARRGAILHELQGLASRIGAFPAPREPAPGLEYADPNGVPQTIAGPGPGPAANGHQRPFVRGDWRQATNNIQEELDIYFQDRAAASH